MLIERIGAVSGYNSHKEIDFVSKLALPALLVDFRLCVPHCAIVTSLNSRSDRSSKVVPSGIFPPANSLATFDMHTAPTVAIVDKCSLLAMYVVCLVSNLSISSLSVIVCI